MRTDGDAACFGAVVAADDDCVGGGELTTAGAQADRTSARAAADARPSAVRERFSPEFYESPMDGLNR
jgi:hypothetical protein